MAATAQALACIQVAHRENVKPFRGAAEAEAEAGARSEAAAEAEVEVGRTAAAANGVGPAVAAAVEAAAMIGTAVAVEIVDFELIGAVVAEIATMVTAATVVMLSLNGRLK